jgi:hypothetical protein
LLNGVEEKQEKTVETLRRGETYALVDPDLCSPHPLLVPMRFSFDSEALQRNIQRNGQLEPCRAIREAENGQRLIIYAGQRRLRAIKALKSKFGTPRYLKVIVDEDQPSEQELIQRSLAENNDEDEQRLAISDLEKISFCAELFKKYNAREVEGILCNSGYNRNSARKIISLADKFEREKLEKLHEIEVKSDFRFKITHLDLLLSSDSEENFYEIASLSAFSQKSPEELKMLSPAAGYFCKEIPWFSEIFPKLAQNKNETNDGPGSLPSNEDLRITIDKELENGASPPDEPDGNPADNRRSSDVRVLPEQMIFVKCFHCRAFNIFKLRTGSAEFIFCNLEKEGHIKQLAMGANAVFDCERECSSCKRQFWVTVSVLEGGNTVISSTESRMVKAPSERVLIQKVYWDGGWNCYNEETGNISRLDSLGVSDISMSSDLQGNK